jgi:hypothetical protein
VEALIVLLPISLAINLLQVAKHYRNIDLTFYSRLLVFALPLVMFSLFVVTSVRVDVAMFIGVFLVMVAAREYSARINGALTFLVRHERICCAVMGVIHGLTNLGGSLLTAMVHSKGYEKHVARVTVAVSYATLALVQLLTLLLAGYRVDIGVAEVASLGVGITVFALTEVLVFRDLRSHVYSKYFAAFLFMSGVFLCLKSF